MALRFSNAVVEPNTAFPVGNARQITILGETNVSVAIAQGHVPTPI